MKQLVFTSGSCRVMTTIGDGRGKFVPLHSMIRNFVGPNFLGKLHNTQQHIQFIKWINDEIQIPNDILCKFLTSHKKGCNKSILQSKEAIKKQFYNVDTYIFEICSLKIYKKKGFDVQHEFTSDYEISVQTEEDMLVDLNYIRKYIPYKKKIIFQVHFRPNIYMCDPAKSIDNRERIYEIVNNFCKINDNTFIHDPSIIIQKNASLLQVNDNHFTKMGHTANFSYIYDNFIMK